MHHLKEKFENQNRNNWIDFLPGLKFNGSIGPVKLQLGFGLGRIVIENVMTRSARDKVKHRTPFCKTFNPRGPCKKQ